MTLYKDTRVAVLFGGKSAEHDVSVNSGLMALQSLSQNFAVAPVYLDRQGGWNFPPRGFDEADPLASARSLLEPGGGRGLSTGQGLARLEELRTGAAFLALHGPFGEDGRLQGLLEMAGIPYTGSGVVGSAMAMDKDISKRLYRAGGLPVAESRSVTLDELRHRSGLLESVVDELGLPLVVKPVAQGSSVGTSISRDRSTLQRSVEQGLEHGASVLIEQFVAGRELTCGVLDLDSTGLRCALPPTLIQPRSAEFFDYGAKYQPGATEEITPAPIEAELFAAVQRAALRAHRLLHLRGYSRTDFMEREGRLFVLETNTLPGLTQTSLFPQAALAAGIEAPTLLCHLVCLATGLESPVQSTALRQCLLERPGEASA